MLALIISIITFVLLTISIVFIKEIKINKYKMGTYWIVALIGAIFLLVFKTIPLDVLKNDLFSENAINPFKILILFFSMTFLSIFLDEVGLFKHLAIVFINKAKTSKIVLFIIIYLFSSILTIFTSNDIVILTLTPFVCFFCLHAKISPLPYLVSLFVASNTWSMMLIIGNPTNIYLGTMADIDFISYLKVMLIPTIVSGIVEFIIVYLLFRKHLKGKIEPSNDKYDIDNKQDLIVGLIHLLSCLIMLVISSYLNIEMYLIAALSMISLLGYIIINRIVTHKNPIYLYRTLKRLPWELIPFVLSMFVIVSSLSYNNSLAFFTDFLNKKNVIFSYGISSFFMSNIINNIPMSMLYSNLSLTVDSSNYLKAVYSSIIGSNIGAFLTPIGALAGIMFTNLTSKYEVKYGYKEFITYGLIISIPTLILCLLSLSFVL